MIGPTLKIPMSMFAPGIQARLQAECERSLHRRHVDSFLSRRHTVPCTHKHTHTHTVDPHTHTNVDAFGRTRSHGHPSVHHPSAWAGAKHSNCVKSSSRDRSVCQPQAHQFRRLCFHDIHACFHNVRCYLLPAQCTFAGQ